MDFDYTAKIKELQARLQKFMDEHIYPNEGTYKKQLQENTDAGKRWSPIPIIEELKKKARPAGLWNLFLPVDTAQASGYTGAGLTNLEYAPLAEIMGRVPWSSEVFNCSAPDTGNMETIARYGSEEIKARWLKPLLEGEIRSAFAMTEPEVASSDATNIQTRIERQGDHYIVNGPGGAAPFAAKHDRDSRGHARHPHHPAPGRVRLRRRAPRPRRDGLRERQGAGGQHPAR
jgi:acyl-CoA dehydrogenase